MIRKLLWLVVLVAPPAFSQSTGTIASGQTARSCNAVTVSSSSFPGTVGGCTALALLTSGGVLPNTYTFQVTGGTATLVGSLNGSSWTTLGTATNTTQTFGGAYTWLGCIATSVSGSLNCNVSVTVGSGGGGGGGGSGTVGTGVNGQYALYNGSTSVAGDPNLTNNGTAITSTIPVSAPSITLPATTTLTPVSGTNILAVNSSGVLGYSANGGAFIFLRGIQINGTAITTTSAASANFNFTNPAQPANGKQISFAVSGAQVSAALVGDGSTNCLSGQGLYIACGSGTGSGTVGAGTGGFFTWYPSAGTTVGSNANLDDSITTATTITSKEPIAAPSINVNGVTGTGIAMTGVGGTLPTVATGSGGVGIGPGGIPQINPNGTGWVAIPTTGGGGSGTVGSGTAGQFAWYNATGTSVVGSTNLTNGGTSITSTLPLVAPALNTPASASTVITNTGQFGFSGTGANTPSINFVGSGGVFRAVTVTSINGTYIGSNTAAWGGTNANPPVCNPVTPTNGRCITLQSSGGNISAALVGNGNATSFLNGTGAYTPFQVGQCVNNVSTATTCAVTFVTPFSGTPVCTVTPGPATGAPITTFAIDSTTFTNAGFQINFTPAQTANFQWICMGNPN